MSASAAERTRRGELWKAVRQPSDRHTSKSTPQFVPASLLCFRPPVRKMRCQHRADVANRIDQRVRKPFVSEMLAHQFNNALPIQFAAFFVDRLIAHNRELVRGRRHENQNSVTFRRFVHPEPVKSLLCRDQRIAIQLSTLDKDADLRGRFRLSLANRPNNSVMLEPA